MGSAADYFWYSKPATQCADYNRQQRSVILLSPGSTAFCCISLSVLGLVLRVSLCIHTIVVGFDVTNPAVDWMERLIPQVTYHVLTWDVMSCSYAHSSTAFNFTIHSTISTEWAKSCASTRQHQVINYWQKWLRIFNVSLSACNFAQNNTFHLVMCWTIS